MKTLIGEERIKSMVSILTNNGLVDIMDTDLAKSLATEINYALNRMEDNSLKTFKDRTKSDPHRIIEPAEILVNTLTDREYMLIMHFGNKIVDCMIEYAHRQVSITERKYEDEIKEFKTKQS